MLQDSKIWATLCHIPMSYTFVPFSCSSLIVVHSFLGQRLPDFGCWASHENFGNVLPQEEWSCSSWAPRICYADFLHPLVVQSCYYCLMIPVTSCLPQLPNGCCSPSIKYIGFMVFFIVNWFWMLWVYVPEYISVSDKHYLENSIYTSFL